jgi:hypothetical protein
MIKREGKLNGEGTAAQNDLQKGRTKLKGEQLHRMIGRNFCSERSAEKEE